MAPGDRGLKWEGQVLGDKDMTTSTLPGVWVPNSLTRAHLLPYGQPKGVFFLFFFCYFPPF